MEINSDDGEMTNVSERLSGQDDRAVDVSEAEMYGQVTEQGSAPGVQPIGSMPVYQPVVDNTSPVNLGQVKENILLGCVGALLGAAIGAVTIVLLSNFGYVAVASGFVMAAATLKLYEKFAKCLSGKGIAICVVIMIIMVLIAENTAFSLAVVNEAATDYGVKVSFWEVFGNLYGLISDEVVDGEVYAINLALVYLFNGIGIFVITKTFAKNRKTIKS